MFQSKATVNEVNHYLKPIVTQLLTEYQKVTHPDFDKALRAKTGIGWKQIKNYRSHPDPTSVIPANSKVIKFVLKSREQDKLYKIKRLLIYSGAILFVITSSLLIRDNIKTERAIYEKDLNTLIEKRLEQALNSKGLNGCVKSSDSKIICGDTVYISKE